MKEIVTILNKQLFSAFFRMSDSEETKGVFCP